MGEEPRWRRYLRLGGANPEADVDDELDFHLEERTRLNIASGMSAEQARAEAAQQFGDMSRIRGECITERRHLTRRAEFGERLGDVVRDIRMGVRSLVRTPLFAVTAGLSLALGIGVNVAVFSVVNAVLLAPLPYAAPERVVTIHNTWMGAEQGGLSPAEYLDYAAMTKALSVFGVYAMSSANVVDGDVAERVPATIATASTLEALGIAPSAGRFYTAGEVAARDPVLVLSYEYWQSRFGGAQDVIGRGVLVNGVVRTVIGVLPPGVRLPGTYAEAQPPALFLPLRIERADDPSRGSHFLRAIARLAPDWTVASADAELKRVAGELTVLHADFYPEQMNFSALVVPVHEAVVGESRRLLLMLSAAVALVLLITCANVSSLVLTRTEDRRRELAVRSALGAGRWRIARQLLMEHLVLATVAAAAGLGIASAGVRALSLFQPGDIPRIADAGIDTRVLLFTLGLTLLTTLLVAAAPFGHGGGGHDALREAGSRTTTSRASQRTRRALIATEVALSIVLLAGAGLLLRSFTLLMAVDPGYRTDQLLTVPVTLPASSYDNDAAVRRFYAQLVDDASQLPGVVAAGAVINLPLATTIGDLNIELDGHTVAAGDLSPRLDWQVVTPGWFDAMGVDILRGRGITAADDERATGAVVLSEAAVRKYWADGDAVGQRFRLGAAAGPGWVTVVGIARDIRHGSLSAEPQPIMYLPHGQFTFWHGGSAVLTMTLVLHTAGEPMAMVAPLREHVRRMDPHVPLGTPRTMAQVMTTAVAEPRFAMSVIGSFALIALGLAAIGVYGLVSYTVARRTREIAVRMALGAQADGVVRQIVLQGMQPVLVGVAIGGLGALATGRLLQHMLYGIAPHDPVILAVTLVLLPATALLACVIPARRATGIEPWVALRE